MEKSNKKPEINLLNVLLCIGVIFIHVASQAVTGLEKGSFALAIVYIPWWLAHFVVAGFLFVSGTKFMIRYQQKEKFSYGKYLWSKVKILVLPYLLWVFLYYWYFCSIGYFPFRIADLIQYMVLGNLVSHFYYIIVSMQFFLLAPVWIKMVKKCHPLFGILSSLFLTLIALQFLPSILSYFYPNLNFLYNDRIFTSYLVYWVAGCYAGANYERFQEILLQNKGFIGITFFLFALANAYFSYTGNTKGIYFGFMETLQMGYCLVAIAAIFLLSLTITKKFPRFFETNGFFAVNGATYWIYLIHCFVIVYCDNTLPQWGISSIKGMFFIKFIATYSICFVTCTGYYYLKKFIKNWLKKTTKVW